MTTTFSTKGPHTVRLKVTDSLGVVAYDTTTIEILNREPIAGFTYSPSNPTTSVEIGFIDTSTDADGTISSWSWDFGDGGGSVAPNPSHRFEDDGQYSVVLTVTDDDGDQDYEEKTITVSNVPPVCGFNYSPSNLTTKDTVQFYDSSTDSDGTIDAWEWSFGDGDVSINQNPTHRFSQAGEFTVSLIVTDDDGDTDTVTVVVVVRQAEEGPLIGLEDSWFWLLLLVIIVVMVLVITFLLFRRRSKEEEYAEESAPEEQPPMQ